MAKPRILVIEDEHEIRELIAYSLGKEGYAVSGAESGEGGLALAERESPDAVVLDVMLPGLNGLDVLRALKASDATRRTPVLLVTARGEDADVIAGLELGADDYVTKPFSPKVLVARVRAALRRSSRGGAAGDGASATGRNDELLSRRGITLDSGRHECRTGTGRVELSATEFALLEVLMRDPGRVFPRSRIIDLVHGHDHPVTDRSVDVQVLSLRKKLGPDGELVETVRGVGYRFSEGD